jgi:hypothetical protein
LLAVVAAAPAGDGPGDRRDRNPGLHRHGTTHLLERRHDHPAAAPMRGAVQYLTRSRPRQGARLRARSSSASYKTRRKRSPAKSSRFRIARGASVPAANRIAIAKDELSSSTRPTRRRPVHRHAPRRRGGEREAPALVQCTRSASLRRLSGRRHDARLAPRSSYFSRAAVADGYSGGWEASLHGARANSSGRGRGAATPPHPPLFAQERRRASESCRPGSGPPELRFTSAWAKLRARGAAR